MNTAHTARAIKERYLAFFSQHKHTVIPSASLVPENDPTVLFTTAGMHPLVPYLLGQAHPGGTRLANCQPCIRTGDIDEVGDESHLTFFEMLGNWSLGDYFKAEAIAYSYRLLTERQWFGVHADNIGISVFGGEGDIPADSDAARLWREHGIPEERIFHLGIEHNWWGPAGTTGPCGPDTEMFFSATPHNTSSPADPSGGYLEIWNDVFMQYNKQADGRLQPLDRVCVDTGMGVERTATVLQGKPSVFETELFTPIFATIEREFGIAYHAGGTAGSTATTTSTAGDATSTATSSTAGVEGTGTSTAPTVAAAHKKTTTATPNPATKTAIRNRSLRIIADHIKAAVMIIADPHDIVPSNLGQGYIVRRLIRRAVRHGIQLGLPAHALTKPAATIIDMYADQYHHLPDRREHIIETIHTEEELFGKTISRGQQLFEKECDRLRSSAETVFPGRAAFNLYDTYGFPIELTVELARERNLTVDMPSYDEAFAQHRATSKAAGAHFKGGLADHSTRTTALHTATHLLHQSLRTILGTHVQQKGSNITAERLRFDFSHPTKIESDQLRQIEEMVNKQIGRALPVTQQTMKLTEATEAGALAFFTDKYSDEVSTYRIGDFSFEVCGGPHVTNTNQLGRFVILKEQSSSGGVRRIKADLV